MKVIKHDSNFGLDVCFWIRNLHLGIRDSCLRLWMSTCKFLGLGQGTDPLYICPSRSQTHVAQPVSRQAITFHRSQIGSGHVSNRQPASKPAGWL